MPIGREVLGPPQGLVRSRGLQYQEATLGEVTRGIVNKLYRKRYPDTGARSHLDPSLRSTQNLKMKLSPDERTQLLAFKIYRNRSLACIGREFILDAAARNLKILTKLRSAPDVL
ncbi:hypothetical protein CONPUDRAFT_70693 [Coniophora puteana RWD-64-598 SS2]|uniref:Uncharacterized protein n=1 Tax=Coniophora puteana (strain RWD-64-598) TaxID=741705 RepID=A0A5M3MYL7_CONPW|nr:uncharacterized protein CONPUDRAFT_70693 [Coniophora puteana RWD-64-598 SS2]EIW83735.1 hypothetical protein CONPUDRAFT_70693 [Coniophora puteana RWD-64-598 SS2]